ncbi:MAG: hypothetical protein IT449_01790 [Phycisphaerales bacterium]|nr:hypothetical protein [Phycisphaerales bacterium]
MKRSVILGVLAAMSLAAGAAFAQAPVDNAFSYQGKLTDNGGAANGLYDFEFSLFDALVAGNQVGATLTATGVNVVDGLFTSELDFGAVYNGTALWLNIGVRPNGGGAFTALTPRQSLTAAPFASYALNTYWTASGSAIQNTNTGFVGINRTSQVSSAEAFGIQSPASGTSYGGMYIRTDSATAKPFYGYTTGTETAWTYLDGNDGTFNIYNGGVRMTIEDGGDIGIGTTDPTAKLHIENGSNASRALFATKTGSGTVTEFRVDSGNSAMPLYAVTYGTGRAALFEAHTSNTTATVHILKNAGPALQVTADVGFGTHDTSAAVSVVGNNDSELASGGLLVLGSVDAGNMSMDGNEIMARNNGAASTLYLNNEGGNTIISPLGHTIVSVLEITGGADFSEGFEVAGAIEPGMVVVIDPANPGELKPATGAYDRKVAGIVSGAGGVKPGMVMSQTGTLASGEHPVALTGRVYCWCDAATGAIQPGDMLTTSNTPGHAMKVADHAAAQGAILGKAMTSLKQGEKGLVLVLVSLQ